MIKRIFPILFFGITIHAHADLRWASPFVILYTTNDWQTAQIFRSSTTFSSSTIMIGGITYFFPSSAPATNDSILHFNWVSSGVYFGGDNSGGAGGGAGGGSDGWGNPSSTQVISAPFGINSSSGIFTSSVTAWGGFTSTVGIVVAATTSPFIAGSTVEIQGIIQTFSSNTASGFGGSAVPVYSSVTSRMIWDTPRPMEFNWNGGNLLAISTNNSPNIAPIVKTTGTKSSEVLGASFDDTLEECRGGSFVVPEYANIFSTPTFTTFWFPSAKGGATGDVIWDLRYSSGIADSNSWDVEKTTVTAAASAGYANANKVSRVQWKPSGVGGSSGNNGGIKGHGTLDSMGWAPLTNVDFNVCREGGNSADNLIGDAVIKQFMISIPMNK